MVKEKNVGKKKTANKKILAAVLGLSLCVNAGLAVRCIFVSGQADRTKEELAAREQEALQTAPGKKRARKRQK